MFLLASSWLFWACFCRSFISFVFTGYVSPFSTCCKAGLVVLNSLNFCSSVKLLIFLSILNETFARYSNHGWRFFSFSTLNIPCHSLLSYRVSAERPTVNCMTFPLYVTYCFSLAAFTILSLWLISVSLISMCLDVFLLGFNCRELCTSWIWLTISFPMLGKFSNIISLKIFSVPFFFSSSGAPITQYWCV